MADLDSPSDGTVRPQDQGSGRGDDVHHFISAAIGTTLDTKVMRQAIRLHERGLAARRSDSNLVDSYLEAVEIRMHETWF